MKRHFRRTLSLLLAAALLLTLLAGCKKGKSADSVDNEALYASILAKYKQALDENWTESKFFEGNLCPLLSPSREKTAEPGFAFLDINRDKRPELFIGRVSEPGVVYDLYTTRSNGTVVQLGVANETTRFVYTADERLIQENTPTEALTATKMLTLNDDALEVTETYIHDADKTFDSENKWFRAEGDVSLDALDAADTLEPISEDAYNEATSYQPAVLSMQSFAAWGTDAAEEDAANGESASEEGSAENMDANPTEAENTELDLTDEISVLNYAIDAINAMDRSMLDEVAVSEDVAEAIYYSYTVSAVPDADPISFRNATNLFLAMRLSAFNYYSGGTIQVHFETLEGYSDIDATFFDYGSGHMEELPLSKNYTEKDTTSAYIGTHQFEGIAATVQDFKSFTVDEINVSLIKLNGKWSVFSTGPVDNASYYVYPDNAAVVSQ